MEDDRNNDDERQRARVELERFVGGLGEETVKAIRKLPERLENDNTRGFGEDTEKLWELLCQWCYLHERARLESESLTPDQALALVKRGWAYIDPDDRGRLVTTDKPSSPLKVPVVLVRREEKFILHSHFDELVARHPFVRLLKRDPATRSELYHFVTLFRELKRAGRKAERLAPGLPQACDSAALLLRHALDPELTLPGEPEGKEKNLSWLTVAKRSPRLWRLLRVAMEAGSDLERYRIFHGTDIERLANKAITHPSGKQAGEEGHAIEEIILAHRRENPRVTSTPKKILKWLGDERAYGAGEKLTGNYRYHTEILKMLTWKRFQSLVNAARTRLSKRNTET
jgi:hypothetical protein